MQLSSSCALTAPLKDACDGGTHPMPKTRAGGGAFIPRAAFTSPRQRITGKDVPFPPLKFSPPRFHGGAFTREKQAVVVVPCGSASSLSTPRHASRPPRPLTI